jgi:hypothetical protein
VLQKDGNIYTYTLLPTPLHPRFRSADEGGQAKGDDLARDDDYPIIAFNLHRQYELHSYPYANYPPISSHTNPFSVLFNSKRALEYAVRRKVEAKRGKDGLSKKALIENVLHNSQWFDCSAKVTRDLARLLGEDRDDEESHTHAFITAATRIAQLEEKFNSTKERERFMKQPGSTTTRRDSDPDAASTKTPSLASKESPPSPSPSGASKASRAMKSHQKSSGSAKNKTSSAKHILRIASLGLARRPRLSLSSPSADTPAALIAQEWQRSHSPTNSSASFHRLSKTLSSVPNTAWNGLRALRRRVTKKGSGITKSVEKRIPVVRLKGMLGAAQNVS